MFNFSRNRTYNKKKILVMSTLFLTILIFLIGRVVYLIFYRGDELSEKAKSLQERERTLVAQRGKILDRNGIVLAENETVYNISVVHNQIEDEEAVIDLLSDKLDMDRELVTEKVSKVTSIEKIKNNVTVLCGPSGAGKSTLINTLKESYHMETGEVSEKIGRGRHTTRHSELIDVQDGYIVDTPGFSTLEVTFIEKDDLKYCFPEFEEYNNSCKFRGCLHYKEPNCAVKNAVEEGYINKLRYEFYIRTLEEIMNWRKY